MRYLDRHHAQFGAYSWSDLVVFASLFQCTDMACKRRSQYRPKDGSHCLIGDPRRVIGNSEIRELGYKFRKDGIINADNIEN